MQNIIHIRQRRWADCGAATIAMVAGVAYERVLESVAADFFIHGLWYGEILHALFKITGRLWTLREFDGQTTLKDFAFPAAASIVCVVRPEMGRYWARHYAVVADGVLFDPLLKEPLSLDAARADHHAAWQVVGLIGCEA
ncbi:MAG TPA: hypothetical protein VD835_15020 [Pyrinomonadaceae bacterium]|nr:hypothetical protein [Pyrinomonadaceae bacterium]